MKFVSGFRILKPVSSGKMYMLHFFFFPLLGEGAGKVLFNADSENLFYNLNKIYWKDFMQKKAKNNNSLKGHTCYHLA